jgi:trehalose utilization protein
MMGSTMQAITRRSLLRTLTLATGAAYAGPKATAFALIGDRYHNSDYIRTGLRKTLAKNLDISIDFCDEVERLTAANLRGYKLLILFRDGMLFPGGYGDESSNAGYVHGGSPAIVSQPPVPKQDNKPVYWMTPAQGAAVMQFVRAGGGALFYHNVTYIATHNDNFRDVLGAVTQAHPRIRPFKVKIVNREHPITRGVNDFVVTDEQHFMTYQKDRKYLLLESVNEDGLTWKDLGTSSPAGWAYDYGKGRVCYLAPGHMLTDLWNPEYEKLQQNAARWVLRQL